MIYIQNKKTGKFLKNGHKYVDYSENRHIYKTIAENHIEIDEKGKEVLVPVIREDYIGDTIYFNPDLYELVEIK